MKTEVFPAVGGALAESRTAAELVNLANHHACSITLVYGGVRVNAKSLMGVFLLAGRAGDEVLTVEVDGRAADEEAALRQIADWADRSRNADRREA